MNVKRALILTGKVIILTVLLIVCFAVASQLSGISSLPSDASAPPADPAAVMNAMLISSLLEVIILTTIILRSQWTGWKLTAAIVLGFYGSMTVVAQLESLVYLQIQLPAGMVSRLFIMGAIVTALFSPIAVLILGKMKRGTTPESGNVGNVMSRSEWIWKIAALALAYVVLYYLFGYYVAWKSPAVRSYYGGTDPGSFLAQMGTVINATPWMLPFQAARALLWIALVLPIVRMLKGNSLEVAVVMALFLAVWSSQLLLPNPYMPVAVAHVHLIETVLSNLLFGFIVGWSLCTHHSSLKDLFRAKKNPIVRAV